MEIKFKKSLNDFDYLVSYDLASHITGVCIFDIKRRKIVSTRVLTVTGVIELPTIELENLVKSSLDDLLAKGIKKEKILICKEAMPTQVHGGTSTIQTFLALARSHAILDTYLYKNNYAVYDYKGVYPVTTHAYYKKLVNADNKYKVTKEDLKNYLVENYDLDPKVTLDESDASFIALTLLDKKWNSDIDEEIRVLKRHKKTLVQNYAKEKIDNEIERLKSLKNI